MKFEKIIILAGLFCLLFSCKHGVFNKHDNDKTVVADSVDIIERSEGSSIELVNRKKAGTLVRQIDTVFDNIACNIGVYESEELLTIEAITGEGEIVSYQYPEIFFVLELTVNGVNVLQDKIITKDFFRTKISEQEISKRQLYSIWVDRITDESIFFQLNLCVPDSDNCYYLYLSVSTKGDVQFEIIDVDYDEWD
jgi:hypothetical protein